MMKATKIVIIFLKNRAIPHELARSVLKFSKISVNLMNDASLMNSQGNSAGISKLIIDTLFKDKVNAIVKKHKLIIRKITNKLIKRCGIKYVTQAMPEYHKPMLAYLEKEKRKKMNKKQKEKLLALMGGEDLENQQTIKDGDNAGESDDADSSSDNEEVDQTLKKTAADEKDSDDESDSDNEAIEVGGYKNAEDLLPTKAMDIPRVDDIPIVSQLARQTEKQRMAEMDDTEKLEYKVEKVRAGMKQVVE